jgi:uncharacterized protein
MANLANPPYWQTYRPSAKALGAIALPILSVTGIYDGDQPGTFAFYREHMAGASAAAREKHYLLIGPWDHAGTRKPQLNVGGVAFAATSQLDMNALHLHWYNYARGHGKRPEILRDKVGYYLTGSEQWRYAQSLEGITAKHDAHYLSSAHYNPDSVFQSGLLSPTQAALADVDSYRYDPLRFDRAEAELSNEDANYLLDQSRVLHSFGNQLIYHTQAFSADTDIAGFFSAELWLRLNVPDTDIQLSLYAIDPSGQSIFLSADLLRARHRSAQTKLITPGQVLPYRFEHFPFTARTLKKGARLRLVIEAPDSLSAQKNFNAANAVERQTAKDAQTAQVELLIGPDTPSRLNVPVAATSTQ